jgi:hypothetical protein
MSGLGGDPLFTSRGATLWNLVSTRPKTLADLVGTFDFSDFSRLSEFAVG